MLIVRQYSADAHHGHARLRPRRMLIVQLSKVRRGALRDAASSRGMASCHTPSSSHPRRLRPWPKVSRTRPAWVRDAFGGIGLTPSPGVPGEGELGPPNV